MARWNRADILLAGVAAAFLALLLLKLVYPEALLVRALFFASEAALVGGIADWFAVTALFKKPLGISYHTALLPRKRQKFTEACVRLVQNEFFSRKKLWMRIKKLQLFSLALEWLETSGARDKLAGMALDALEDMIGRVNRRETAAQIEIKLKDYLAQIPSKTICIQAGDWILLHRKEEQAFDAMLAEAKKKLTAPETKQEIWDWLQEYMDEKNQGMLAVLANLLAQASNIVNYEEAAELLQKHLLQLVDDLLMPDHPARLSLLKKLRGSIAEALHDESCQALVDHWRRALEKEISLQEQIEVWLDAVLRALLRQAPNETELPVIPSPLAVLVMHEMDRCLHLAEEDADIRKALERLFYEVLGKSVLQAQTMVGVIVHEALSRMDDESMNRMVISKVEKDLLWIRMNGSIVGAVIGLGIFFLLEVIR